MSLKRISTVMIPAILSTLSYANAAPSPEDQYVMKVETKEINVPGIVYSKTGRHITLQPSDFEVSEDGVRQQIKAVKISKQAENFVFLLDESGSMAPYMDAVSTATHAAADKLLEKGGKVSVYGFGGNTFQDSELSDRIGDVERGLARRKITHDGSAIFEAIKVAAQYLATQDESLERNILLLSDGGDNRSDRSGIKLDDVIDYCREHQIHVHVIEYHDPKDERYFTENSDNLHRITSGTHGMRVNGQGDRLASAFAELATSLSNKVEINYHPNPLHEDGRKHDISVKILNSDLVGKFRSSYIAPDAAAIQARAEEQQAVDVAKSVHDVIAAYQNQEQTPASELIPGFTIEVKRNLQLSGNNMTNFREEEFANALAGKEIKHAKAPIAGAQMKVIEEVASSCTIFKASPKDISLFNGQRMKLKGPAEVNQLKDGTGKSYYTIGMYFTDADNQTIAVVSKFMSETSVFTLYQLEKCVEHTFGAPSALGEALLKQRQNGGIVNAGSSQ